MAVEQRLYTIEEFEEYADSPENADRLLELVNGEIVEKAPTEEHGLIVMIIGSTLVAFAHSQKLGRVTAEVRYRKPGDKQNARIPDVSFSASKRPVVGKGSVPEMPDLAVEIKSPDDSLRQMREKAKYFVANGTRIVWLVIPEKRFDRNLHA
jgi:Uma2 family endonuclease